MNTRNLTRTASQQLVAKGESIFAQFQISASNTRLMIEFATGERLYIPFDGISEFPDFQAGFGGLDPAVASTAYEGEGHTIRLTRNSNQRLCLTVGTPDGESHNVVFDDDDSFTSLQMDIVAIPVD